MYDYECRHKGIIDRRWRQEIILKGRPPDDIWPAPDLKGIHEAQPQTRGVKTDCVLLTRLSGEGYQEYDVTVVRIVSLAVLPVDRYHTSTIAVSKLFLLQTPSFVSHIVNHLQLLPFSYLIFHYIVKNSRCLTFSFRKTFHLILHLLQYCIRKWIAELTRPSLYQLTLFSMFFSIRRLQNPQFCARLSFPCSMFRSHIIFPTSSNLYY